MNFRNEREMYLIKKVPIESNITQLLHNIRQCYAFFVLNSKHKYIHNS